jgi:hypothetical protein
MGEKKIYQSFKSGGIQKKNRHSAVRGFHPYLPPSDSQVRNALLKSLSFLTFQKQSLPICAFRIIATALPVINFAFNTTVLYITLPRSSVKKFGIKSRVLLWPVVQQVILWK